MSIVVIVNMIVSLGILLGGLSMKQRSGSSGDYSMGFRTKRAMSSNNAWSFANQKCGILWLIIGIISFILTVSAFFMIQNERTGSIVQVIILVFIIVSAITSAIMIEKQLKSRFDNNK